MPEFIKVLSASGRSGHGEGHRLRGLLPENDVAVYGKLNNGSGDEVFIVEIQTKERVDRIRQVVFAAIAQVGLRVV